MVFSEAVMEVKVMEFQSSLAPTTGFSTGTISDQPSVDAVSG